MTETPAATANARWILYQRVTGAGGNLFLIHEDMTGNRQIAVAAPGMLLHPDWSPDGAKIAFVSGVDSSIWVADLDGKNARRVADCCDYPAWSPDGERIAYTVYDTVDGVVGPAASSIDVVQLSTGQVVRVIRRERPLLVDVARWSSDGSQLVVGIDQMDDDANETGAAVGVVGIDDHALVQLTEFDRFGYAPDWGRSDQIVFVAPAFGGSAVADLWLVAPDGTGLIQLTHSQRGTDLRDPMWSRDATQIICAVEGSGELVLVDPDTGEMTILGGSNAAHPHLQP